MKVTGLKTFLVNLGGQVDWGTDNNKTVQRPGLSQDKLDRLRQLFGHIAEPIGN